MTTNIRPEEAHKRYRILLESELARLLSVSLEEVNCPLCGFEDGEYLTNKINSLMSYLQCATCGLAYLKKRPPIAAIQEYYQKGESSSYFHEYILQPTTEIRKNTLFKERYNNILKSLFKSESRVLDVGCSVGTSLEVLAEAGHTALGFELNEVAAKLAKDHHQTVYSDYNELQTKVSIESLDAVTAWEVIAHYSDLMRELNLAAGLIKAGGVFVLTTPNVEALEYRLLAQKHPNFSFPFLQLFSPKSIQFLFEKLGFKIEHLSTPGQRDLQTIGEYFPAELLPKAIGDFLFKSDELNQNLRQSVQRILNEQHQSGHMLVIARKS